MKSAPTDANGLICLQTLVGEVEAAIEAASAEAHSKIEQDDQLAEQVRRRRSLFTA